MEQGPATCHDHRTGEQIMTLGGAILVGGSSTRMGEPKHMVRLADGRTMTEHIADSLRHVCEVLAIVGLRDPASARLMREMFPNAALVHDREPGQGPLAGIHALLETKLCDAYIVCSCDTPLVDHRVLEALARPAASPTSALKVQREETIRPLPCRVGANALPLVARLLESGRLAVHELHKAAGAHVIDAPAEWADALLNVNTPSDRDAADARLASRPAAGPRSRSIPVAEIVTRRPGVREKQ